MSSNYSERYAEGFTDYEGTATGPAFPWIQVSAEGMFYAEAKEADEPGKAAHFLASIGGKEWQEGDRDVIGCDALIVNLIARRRRFLIADPRDGRTLAIRSDYDAAEAEAYRQRAKVRGHVQALAIVSPPKGVDVPPFVAMITAKGVQSSNLWALEKTIYERCVRPVERDGSKGIPPLAYSVLLGFAPKITVGTFGHELCPLTVRTPARTLDPDAARALIRLPYETTRKVYDDSRAWIAAWTRHEDAAPRSEGRQGAPPARDAGRQGAPPARDAGRQDGPHVFEDDIPF